MNTKQHQQQITTGLLAVAGVVTTGLVATLVAATVTTAGAVPSRPHDEVGAGWPDYATRVTTACTITPHTWNSSVDGPMWQCYRYLR